MSANHKFGLLASLTIFTIVGCDSESSYDATPSNPVNEFGFDFQTGSLPKPKEPSDNVATEEKFQLGRHLFMTLSFLATKQCHANPATSRHWRFLMG